MFPALLRMRFASFLCVGALTLASFAVTFHTAQGQQDNQESKLLRHVVMFQFKATSSEADVKTVVDAFRALPSKISQISDFEYGTNNSPEQLSNGLTHIFFVTFKSEEDRAAYLPHPAHEAFVKILKPHLEKATVVDYWANK